MVQKFREWIKLKSEAMAVGRDLMKDPDTRSQMYRTYSQSYTDPKKGLKPWPEDQYFAGEKSVSGPQGEKQYPSANYPFNVGFIRAPGWLYFGVLPGAGVPDNEVGVITARVDGPLLKLTGTQGGSLSGKSKGLEEAMAYAKQKNLAIFAALEAKMANILVKKFGFIQPPPKVVSALFPFMQQSHEFSAGGTWDSVNPESGAINFKMQGLKPGEDVLEKHLVGNEQFFRWFINDKILPSVGVQPAMLKMAKGNPMGASMALGLAKKKGLNIDEEVMNWMLQWV